MGPNHVAIGESADTVAGVTAQATALVAAVVGLGIALPMHYFDLFAHDWLTHLGPIYLATVVFVVGAILAYRGIRSEPRTRGADGTSGGE